MTGLKDCHSENSVASVVELKEKSPSRERPELGRLFLFLEYGARSAPFGPKRRVRAAHGRARILCLSSCRPVIFLSGYLS
jgi:hypothetical protein